MSIRDNQRDHGPETPEVLTTTEARQGASTHVTRYVLGWGLFLVVCAFLIIYFVMYR
ncbi:conserved hypothetical protein [Methylocella silvestris BL2]|uniref:Uncharacterized protein n=1 Tax=Methylocella silvestris (strain DSM 15510 / CIP 108128 / LMG 27833 / NCIMB 13906 / BL2) TaxID=395965 RepID=B8EKD6_METSB|nr:hypothetical protein [Methylocella silvestris]ACK50676.1 conserved hypothetical protein [Methylocella silvestris BL2]